MITSEDNRCATRDFQHISLIFPRGHILSAQGRGRYPPYFGYLRRGQVKENMMLTMTMESSGSM